MLFYLRGPSTCFNFPEEMEAELMRDQTMRFSLELDAHMDAIHERILALKERLVARMEERLVAIEERRLAMAPGHRVDAMHAARIDTLSSEERILAMEEMLLARMEERLVAIEERRLAMAPGPRVDAMHAAGIDTLSSYERMLALEERIGNVSTGLSEEAVAKSLKQHKYTSMEEEERCCICQEEYVEMDDLGRLDCGHNFHSSCIKQWLVHKNLCPICKNTALITK